MRKISLEGHSCPKSLASKHFLLVLKATLFFLLFTITPFYAHAQSGQTVKGSVKDNAGIEIIGANVLVKGTSNGSITDFDGNFTINDVKINDVIQFSYIGYTAQEVVYTGQPLHIVLIEDAQTIDEVVVTALGIKRDRKSLGYALSEVKGDALLESRDANVANSLAGKVAGLQIKQSGTGPAGSSRIVLRGNNSLSGNNQPLVVVDGVPIDSGTGGSDDYWGNRAVDRGSGMSDISPDDIESISVLKGPAAAALYGSRAGNGVIMITTKTGKGTKGLGISVNSNLTYDSPMELPKMQNVYGQGTGGEINTTTGESWGAKMTGQNYSNYVGRNLVYDSYDNKLTDFIRTGSTWTNSVDITNATDKNTFRLGIMHLDNKGIVPNSDFNRTSITLRGTAQLSEKLSVDAKISYINQKTNNRVKLGGDPDNIFNNYLIMPRSWHMSDFTLGDGGYKYLDGASNPYGYPKGTIASNGADLSSNPVSWRTPDGGNVHNLYWAAYNNTNQDRKNRLIGFTSMKYEFTDWLNIQGRYGMDYTSTEYQDRLFQGTPYWTGSHGITFSKDENYEINADLLLTFNKNFDKLGIVATAGGNTMYSRSSGMWAQTMGLEVENFYHLSNGTDVSLTNSLYRKKINSLYATASASWDNMIYLDLTARNDWSSSLNKDNRSYFYSSVGASWLFTETFSRKNINLGPLNYGKLRLSLAQVGNDTDAYQLFNYRQLKVDHKTGKLTSSMSSVQALYDLKNETINSWEVGLEMRAFNNRLGLDLTYYSKDAKDQILKVDLPAQAGVYQRYINAGKVRNSGWEVMLTGTPVQNREFQWNVALNWAKNNNKIVALADGVNVQELGDSSYASMLRIYAVEGGTYGDLWGSTLKRDEQGNLLLSNTGLPIVVSEYSRLGNNNPDWMGGITNSFRYKNFELSFQVDMRYGGDVYMGSIRNGSRNGTLKQTLTGREEMIVPGIVESTGQVNTIKTTAQHYWGALGGITEPWIYDATNIRLRELSFGYKLPNNWLSNTPIRSAKISFVGRNLWMIYSKTDGFDPEAGFSTGNAQGFEYGSMPTLRSLGLNINVTF